MVDVGIHVAKGGDHVLWLYYITSYILFKYKPLAERWGLKLQTFSASDYSKDADKSMNSVWTRWVRFRCTTENYWAADPLKFIEEVSIEASVNNPVSYDIATSLDVPEYLVDRTANKGLVQEPVSIDDEYDTYMDSSDDGDDI
jgi:hypothetical protein